MVRIDRCAIREFEGQNDADFVLLEATLVVATYATYTCGKGCGLPQKC